MGLFVLNHEKVKTVEGLIQTAEENIKLFKSNPKCTYLLSTFACQCLEDAATLRDEEAKKESE